MLVKDLEAYSGQKTDVKPPSDLTTQYGANAWNRAHEDLAQTTRTISRAITSFLTVTSGDPDPLNTTHRSVWGVSATEKPVWTRLSTGLYLATYGTSFDDGLGLPDSIESVAFAFPPKVWVMSADADDDIRARPVSFTSNTFTIGVYAAGVLADIGDNSTNPFTVIAEIT